MSPSSRLPASSRSVNVSAGCNPSWKRGIAELDVEIDQAGLAAERGLPAAKRAASWPSSAVAPTPPSLLMIATTF